MFLRAQVVAAILFLVAVSPSCCKTSFEEFQKHNKSFEAEISALKEHVRGTGYLEGVDALDESGLEKSAQRVIIQVENYSNKILGDPRLFINCGHADRDFGSLNSIGSGGKDAFVFHDRNVGLQTTCGAVSWQIKSNDDGKEGRYINHGKGLRLSLSWYITEGIHCGSHKHNQMMLHFSDNFVDKSGDSRNPSQEDDYDYDLMKTHGHKDTFHKRKISIQHKNNLFIARAIFDNGCKSHLKLQLLGLNSNQFVLPSSNWFVDFLRTFGLVNNDGSVPITGYLLAFFIVLVTISVVILLIMFKLLVTVKTRLKSPKKNSYKYSPVPIKEGKSPDQVDAHIQSKQHKVNKNIQNEEDVKNVQNDNDEEKEIPKRFRSTYYRLTHLSMSSCDDDVDVEKNKGEETSTKLENRVKETSTKLEYRVKETSTKLENRVKETSTKLENRIKETPTKLENRIKETPTKLENRIKETPTKQENKVKETSTKLENRVKETPTKLENKLKETSTKQENRVKETPKRLELSNQICSSTESETESPEYKLEALNQTILDEERSKKAYLVAKEILSSEKVYVEVLQLLNITFKQFLKNHQKKYVFNVVPEEELNEIFVNLSQLLSINQSLLKDFKERVNPKTWEAKQKISDVIINKGPYLKVYSTYISKFSDLCGTFRNCCKNFPKFGKLVKEFEALPICQNMQIEHYLLKPVQRLPQYRLLLKDYLKHQAPKDPDYEDTVKALEVVSDVVEGADEQVKQENDMKQLLVLQGRITNMEVIKPGRDLIKQAEIQKLSSKGVESAVYLVLLSDCLLYTKYQSSWSGKLEYNLWVEHTINLSQVKVEGSKTDTLIKITSPVKSFTFRTKDMPEKCGWLEALKQSINKNMKQKECKGACPV